MPRSLSEVEARRLLSAAQAAEHDKKASERWPGEYNIRVLADAVNKRRQFVEFDGKRFSIRYDEETKTVYVKPANNGFVPCGHFAYDKLKSALVD